MTTVHAGVGPTRATLDNGIVLLAKETKTMPAATIFLSLGVGSIADPQGAVGAMYLLSQMLDRGTTSRSADEIAEALDDRGVALAANVTRHALTLVCTCLADDFEDVLALLGDMVMSPSIPGRELAIRKGEVITRIRQDEDDPAIRATEMLVARLYPNHPYGRPTKGTVEVVDMLTRERLLDLHAKTFSPARLTAAIVGDVAVSRAADAVRRVFGGWPARTLTAVDVAHVQPARERTTTVVEMMNKSQADIAYGFIAMTRADRGYYACWLMNNALGQYAIGGRIGDSIRERQGLAYYVSSSLDSNIVEGPLMIRAGVAPENVDRAVASIDEEIARLLRDGLTEQEFTESRQYLIGSLPRTLETNEGIAKFLQTSEFFGLGLDYDVRVPDLLNSVTRDQTLAVARRVLDPARATIALAGPYKAS
jgi:zinc protease